METIMKKYEFTSDERKSLTQAKQRIRNLRCKLADKMNHGATNEINDQLQTALEAIERAFVIDENNGEWNRDVKVGHLDFCPACNDARVEFDSGEQMTRDEPGQEPVCICPTCGADFPVDWGRNEKRLLACSIARDLFTTQINGNVSARAKRLVLELSGNVSLKTGWGETAVVDRIFNALMENESKC